MKTAADWLALKNRLNSTTFDQILDMGYEYAWKTNLILHQLQRGHTNWQEISNLEPLMHELVTEYERLVSTKFPNPEDTGKLREDIQHTLVPLYKDKVREWRVQWFEMGIQKGPETLELTINQYLVYFSNFIESRIYNKLARLVTNKEEYLLLVFAQQSIKEAGIVPSEKEEETKWIGGGTATMPPLGSPGGHTAGTVTQAPESRRKPPKEPPAI